MIERFATVRVKNLLSFNEKVFPECFIKTRRLKMQGTVDSPVYLIFNKYWLVKHITSKVVNGISIGRYGIYHEDELEIIAMPTVSRIEEPKKVGGSSYHDDDAGFTYGTWDDVP